MEDFGFDNFDFANDPCPDCGAVLNNNKNRFIDHMGLKHSRVERYLPEQYHLPEPKKCKVMLKSGDSTSLGRHHCRAQFYRHTGGD